MTKREKLVNDILLAYLLVFFAGVAVAFLKGWA